MALYYKTGNIGGTAGLGRKINVQCEVHRFGGKWINVLFKVLRLQANKYLDTELKNRDTTRVSSANLCWSYRIREN